MLKAVRRDSREVTRQAARVAAERVGLALEEREEPLERGGVRDVGEPRGAREFVHLLVDSDSVLILLALLGTKYNAGAARESRCTLSSKNWRSNSSTPRGRNDTDRSHGHTCRYSRFS
jgi:hypothetical protein